MKLRGIVANQQGPESWRVLKTLKSPFKGNVVPLIKVEERVRHYEALLSGERSAFVTGEEVLGAVQKAKIGKSLGSGGIPAELLQLTDIINGMLRGFEGGPSRIHLKERGQHDLQEL